MNDIEGIARTILTGFDKHYELFRQFSREAKIHFERGQWQHARGAGKERILGYEARVKETVQQLNQRYPEASRNTELWPRIKSTYISLLMNHLQAECAETFYNSVACQVLHRSYYKIEYIFWRPAISTEHLDSSGGTYRSFYPGQEGLRKSLLQLLTGFELANPFENLRRDVRYLEDALLANRSRRWKVQPNYQLQVLGNLFFRNKAAFIIGREVNGDDIRPLVIPILQNSSQEIFLDALLMRAKEVSILFSFARAYFMTDMDVPSAYVDFLHSIMPTKSPVDLYALLGLQKHAKTLFYRELQHHLKHSRDNFRIAPGIRGMVMLVFTLPSFNFVFKIIRDHADPPKKISRAQVKQKYALVKYHDRVGRLADTLEYSDVAIPLDRIEPDLLDELNAQVPSLLEIDGENLVIKHCYIERRMIPLNEYLSQATGKHRRQAIYDYGRAIRDLAGANIFPGDMMHKNFGLTRHQRVVFYDYDEICYMTDCRFRNIPAARCIDDEMSTEPWYSVEENDVFPETFDSFFFPNKKSRELFLKHHHELIEVDYWKTIRETIIKGGQADVFSYSPKMRFGRRG